MGKVSGRFEAWFQANPKAAEWVDGWLAARAAGEDVRGTRVALAVLRDEFGCPFASKSQPAFLNWLKRYRAAAWAAAANAPKLAAKARSEAIAELRAKARAAAAESKTDAELLAEDRARAAERRQSREARRIIRELERELRNTKERTAFLDALAAAPDPRPYEVKKRKGQGARHQAAAYVMLASDWHVEERVRPETCQWRNEYNPDIAQERARNFFLSNIKMLNAARSAWDIRQGILWLGGDIITGYIHEEYEEENFLSPTEASLLAFRMINDGIQTLLDKADLDHLLVPTSNGNHGRTMKKPRVSTAAKNSFEWLLYQFLAMRFANEKRVTFQISNGYHNVVDVFGYRIRFHHGDAIGYAGGIGGLSIPVNRRIGRQAKADPAPVHLDVIGHFHTLQSPKDFVCNGSLIGWNAYAERIGCGYEEPMQASFVVDERYKLLSNFNPIIVKRGR